MHAQVTAASTQHGDSQNSEASDRGRQMLASALGEAQATVRAYDTKAQIVGVGYLFAMNLVAMVDKALPSVTSIGIWVALVSWLVIIAPVIMFGNVLRPSRKALGREIARDHPHVRGILYVVPSEQHTVSRLCDDARACDPCREYASELLKVSKLREIKRSRFMLALYMATLSFAILFSTHIYRAID